MARFSKKSLEGYLQIDNRAGGAPQIDAAQQAAFEASHGKLIGAGVEGVFEVGTLTCCHCHVQMVVNPHHVGPRNWCAYHDKYVCPNPKCILECPGDFLDKIQNHAARVRAF